MGRASVRRALTGTLGGVCLLAIVAALLPPPASATAGEAEAQVTKRRPGSRMGPRRPPPPLAVPGPVPEVPLEKVEADVSTRSVEVTTDFTGHEILVFGAIDNSQQPADHSGSAEARHRQNRSKDQAAQPEPGRGDADERDHASAST